MYMCLDCHKIYTDVQYRFGQGSNVCMDCYNGYISYADWLRNDFDISLVHQLPSGIDIDVDFKPSDCHGTVVEVDELMIPVVYELNKRGYITEECCSGHGWQNYNIYSYIRLEQESFNRIKKFELPEGWYYDNESCMINYCTKNFNYDENMRFGRNVLNCMNIGGNLMDVDRYIERQKEIFSAISNMIDFISGLEPTDTDSANNMCPHTIFEGTLYKYEDEYWFPNIYDEETYWKLKWESVDDCCNNDE